MRTVERNIEGIQDESEYKNKINMMTELNNILRRTGKTSPGKDQICYCIIKI